MARRRPRVIDGALVNGSASAVGWMAGVVRRVQTGFLYTYAFWMVIGLALLLGWFLVGRALNTMHALRCCRS